MPHSSLTAEPGLQSLHGGGQTPHAGRRVIRVTSRLNVGGIARHVTWLSAGLAEHGYDTTLVAGSLPPGEESMLAFARENGVEPFDLPEMSRAISVKDAITVWKLYRLLVRTRPEVVHTHAAKAGAVARAAGILYRWLTPSALWGRPRPLRMVHTFHGHVFHSYFGPIITRCYIRIERLLARFTDRIIVISPQQRREIHETFGVGRPEQFDVIPLGIDLDAYAGAPERRHLLRRELGAASDELLVGIVGRLTEIKNHDLFLRAAARCRELLPGRRVRFLVIGAGHLRPALEAQTRVLNLTDDVTFLGMRNDPEVFYPALDVLALTSLNEGTPLTVIEAMANGVPVIATNVGGVVDLLGPAADAPAVRERGLLVPSQDEAAFADGLSKLLTDAALRQRLGLAGLRFVNAHHSRYRLLADLAELYDRLLDSPRSPSGKESG